MNSKKNEPVMVRLTPEQLALLDQWRGKQTNPPTRPAAIRALLAVGLAVAEAKKQKEPAR